MNAASQVSGMPGQNAISASCGKALLRPLDLSTS